MPRGGRRSPVWSRTLLPGTRRGEHAGGRRRCTVERRGANRLAAAARAHGLTLNTVVQGAWGLLLGRLHGPRDVVFGTTVSGRPSEVDGIDDDGRPVRQHAAGPGALAARPAGRRGAAPASQAAQSELMDHQHLGLAELQRLAGLPALFDTLLVFENYPLDATLRDPARHHRGRRRVARTATGHYPLALIVVPGERLTIHLEYDGARVPAESVARIGASLTHLLADWRDLTRPVARLDTTATATCTVPRGPAGASRWPSLVDAQAARTPDAPGGARGRDRSPTASWPTGHLAAAGRGARRVVAVALPRSAELMVALLGVLHAGAAYLPVDPDLAGRAPDLAARRTPARRRRLTAADVRPPAAPGPVARCRAPRRTHPAYLIYTSGSTGRPKGVVVPHRAIVNQLAWMRGEFPLGPDDRVLQQISARVRPSRAGVLLAAVHRRGRGARRPGRHRDPACLAG